MSSVIAGLRSTGEAKPGLYELVQKHGRHSDMRRTYADWAGAAPRSGRLVRMGPMLSAAAGRRLKWMQYSEEHRRNARLTCRHFDISPQTIYRWWRRFERDGDAGLEQIDGRIYIDADADAEPERIFFNPDCGFAPSPRAPWRRPRPRSRSCGRSQPPRHGSGRTPRSELRPHPSASHDAQARPRIGAVSVPSCIVLVL
ncbi:MAG: helix-turn-helix domain-containing protein [Candidatus Binatia bacterium]